MATLASATGIFEDVVLREFEYSSSSSSSSFVTDVTWRFNASPEIEEARMKTAETLNDTEEWKQK